MRRASDDQSNLGLPDVFNKTSDDWLVDWLIDWLMSIDIEATTDGECKIYKN